jgi:hypothetical protein
VAKLALPFSEQAPQHSITLLYTKLFKDKILCYPKNFPTIPLVECWADGRQVKLQFFNLVKFIYEKYISLGLASEP